jgi:hypothetical protein
MDRTQRLNDLPSAIDNAIRSKQGAIWTALPGIIESYDAAKLTCSVQPAIQGVLSDPKTGDARNVNLPLLVDCPVIFPSGGGVTLTFPIQNGDECLVVFASRCIDAWWQSGGVQAPMVYRMHDLSDGFIIVGPRSQANLIGDVSTSRAELRSDDGAVKLGIDGSGLYVDGTMNVNGDIVLNGKSLKDHIHSGVQAGAANSGPMA